MWCPLTVVLFVGLIFANTQAFQRDTEYVYQVYGRTLTGLDNLSDRYSGILYKSKLVIRPKSSNELLAALKDAQYAQFNSHLPGGWQSDLPDSELQYKQLPVSGMPFIIKMQDGVVQDLIVESSVSNVEANMLRSIVSQIQFDTQGKNLINSRINQLPKDGSNSAVFKTMESSVTGKFETLYEINPLPAVTLEYKPWLAPYADLKGDGEVIEIVKHKNYSNAEALVEYHYGLEDLSGAEPSTNFINDFFLRSSVSQAVITGNLKNYIIQSSVTVNKVILSPTLSNQEKGMVVSYLNLTLASVSQENSAPSDLSEPKSLETLIYRYDDPFASDMSARRREVDSSAEYTLQTAADLSSLESSENSGMRIKRHLSRDNENSADWNSDESTSETNRDSYWAQKQTPIRNPPRIPLLPSFVGYKGKSVRFAKGMNIVNKAEQLAKEIGQELQDPQNLLDKQTLSKYIILVEEIRNMQNNEIQQIAKELYTKRKEASADYESWVVFRDAVAESGTGPALLAISNWIVTGKVDGNDAAAIVSSMAHSAGTPSEEYVETFAKMVFRKEVQSQPALNISSLLSLSELVEKVYVNKEASKNAYPVHSFGTFRSKAGRNFVVNKYIPYLGKMLDQAVDEADSPKIQVYITALANIGHPEILEYFEPYLEGKRPMSKFQRYLIVSNLDRLTRNFPKIARSVLYKIYQNPGETPEVRIAAIYMLMKAAPPASMLQRMAEFTNIEPNQQVNAAVKSSIMSASKLEGEKFSTLRSNARAAVPLLTPKEYGSKYSFNGLFTHGSHNKETFQTLGGFDSHIPKDIKFSFHHNYGDLTHRSFGFRHTISSISGLHKLLKSDKDKFYSDLAVIYMRLGLEIDEPQEVEGNFYYQLGSLHGILPYGNQTIMGYKHALKEFAESLKRESEGKKYHFTKFLNREEQTISFPTDTGFPFVYTVDRPTVLRYRLKDAKLEIQPSSNRILSDQVKAGVEVEALLSTKIEGQLGFITPFDHQQYSSGYERNFQAYLPLKLKLKVDPTVDRRLKVEVQFKEPQANTRVLQYTSIPYVSSYDILDLQPVLTRPGTKVLRTAQPQPQTIVVGRKDTGVAFRVLYDNEDSFMDAKRIYQQYAKNGVISAAMSALTGEGTRYSDIRVEYAGDKSSSSKMILRYGHFLWTDYTKDIISQSNVQQLSEKVHPLESAIKLSENIKSASVGVAYLSATFDGEESVKYTAIAGHSKSLVDEESRLWLKLEKDATVRGVRPAYLQVSARTFIPIASEVDPLYNLQNNLNGNATIKMEADDGSGSTTRVKVDVDFHTSEHHKQKLQKSPLFKQCLQQQKQDKYFLPACANITTSSANYDHFRAGIQYENLGAHLKNASLQLYSMLRNRYYNHVEEDFTHSHDSDSDSNSYQVEMEVHHHPQMQTADVTVTSDKYRAVFREINVDKQVRAVKTAKHLLGDSSERSCNFDKGALNTFDNRTFDVASGEKNVMMMFYATHVTKPMEQWKGQSEYYQINVHQTQSGNKEVKISLGLRKNIYTIRISPDQGSSQAKINVNGKDLSYDDNRINYAYEGLLQVYSLPQGELKMRIHDAFDVVYQVKRVRITLVNSKFSNSVRGACGNFNGEPEDDYLVPNNCVVRDSQTFIDSYTLSSQGQGQRREYEMCAPHDKIYYANVISDMDKVHSQPWHHTLKSRGLMACKKQTIYKDEGNKVCFSVERVNICRENCTPKKTAWKDVPLHCIASSVITDDYKRRIDQGESPDFSGKPLTKTVRMEQPEMCLYN